MKTFLALLVLCCLCTAQKHSSVLLQAPNVDSKEGVAETQEPRTEDEVQADIWAELRVLRDLVVEQKVELRHLTARVTAAESQVEALQKENTAMEARMTAAESLAEELQMENDAQATELAVAQETLSTLQQRVTVSEHRVEELEKQQEGQKEAVHELQNTNRVRQVAFSASLLASGEGNTDYGEQVQLIYENVISNIGNRYNPHTGYFTAAVRGVYYFRFTGYIAHSNTHLRMSLFKNGHLTVTSGDRHTTSKDDEDTVSNGVMLQLEVGDVVSIQVSGVVWDDQYHRTTFTGFLLFPL
ncbi:uncharacterized protein LOC122982927 [Thunnus albacares]|uniref:uncharacterized protein LOC122982927 n=1 Tax=Thunnus albacares TaxID=8236 RepID=UPI001CF63E04|nr:uncharacterized protein LOC122982927 [Thunnus albacares]